MDYEALARRMVSCYMSIARDEPQRMMNRLAKGERFVLSHLAFKGPSQPSEIAAHMGASTAHIAKMLGDLEEKGLIERAMDRRDRRKIIVTLTDSGESFFQAALDAGIAQAAHILEALGEADAQNLVRILERIVQLHSLRNEYPSD